MNQQSETKIDIEKYLSDGYYIGNTSEIFGDIDHFYKLCDEICEYSKDKETRFLKNYQYRFQYPDCDKDGKLHFVKSFWEIEERDKYLKNMGYKTIQRWWERPCGGDLHDYTIFFRNTIEKFISKLYPELEDNVEHNDAFTLYENGDFIERHYDGRSPERNCVVIIYLSDKKNYNDGGGKLIVGKKNEELKIVEPTRDKFVIMDFTKHDIIHEVEPVKNDFQRNSYITFVHNEELYYKKELQMGRQSEIDVKKYHERAARKIYGDYII